MKPYIAAYKTGASTPTVTADQMVYWYRPTPWDVTCTGDPLGPPNGRNLLADVVFVTTMLTSPAQLTVQSGTLAPVTINVPAGIMTNNFTMGLGTQTFQVTRNGANVMGGTGGKQITNTCVYYNYNAYVGSFNGTGVYTPPPSTSTSISTSTSMSRSVCSVTYSSTSSSSTIAPPPSTTTTAPPPPPPTSTTSSPPPPPPTSTAGPPPGSVCIAGTGPGNYVGLCNFCCMYGYCPPGPCTCTSYGNAIPPPAIVNVNGYPLPGEDNSYLGLCSFSCNHGYCPPTACAHS